MPLLTPLSSETLQVAGSRGPLPPGGSRAEPWPSFTSSRHGRIATCTCIFSRCRSAARPSSSSVSRTSTVRESTAATGSVPAWVVRRTCQPSSRTVAAIAVRLARHDHLGGARPRAAAAGRSRTRRPPRPAGRHRPGRAARRCPPDRRDGRRFSAPCRRSAPPPATAPHRRGRARARPRHWPPAPRPPRYPRGGDGAAFPAGPRPRRARRRCGRRAKRLRSPAAAVSAPLGTSRSERTASRRAISSAAARAAMRARWAAISDGRPAARTRASEARASASAASAWATAASFCAASAKRASTCPAATLWPSSTSSRSTRFTAKPPGGASLRMRLVGSMRPSAPTPTGSAAASGGGGAAGARPCHQAAPAASTATRQASSAARRIMPARRRERRTGAGGELILRISKTIGGMWRERTDASSGRKEGQGSALDPPGVGGPLDPIT